jgi:uncharacterized tellurite resistance protein B-like protein
MNNFDEGQPELSQEFLRRKEQFLSVVSDLAERVRDEAYVELLLSDILPLAPSFFGSEEPEYDAVNELMTSLAELRIETYPKLGKASAHKSLSSAVVLFRAGGGLDTTQVKLKSVLLFIKLGVAVAKADSVIDDRERAVILKSIEHTPLLTLSEVGYLKAAAIHIMGEGVNRDLLLDRLEALRPELKDALLELAMSVAIADREIAKSEVSVIQEFYKALGLNPRKVRGALDRYAKDHHVDVAVTETSDMDFDRLLADDASLDDLLDEFTF